MDRETINRQEETFNLIAYMISSARGLYDEPPDYGSFRLLDAAGRLLEILNAAGELDPFLTQLKEEIDAEREGSMDDARQRQNLERWVFQIAKELRRLAEAD